MAEQKKSDNLSKEGLKDKLDDVTFKNESIARINALQSDNDKLKNYIGRKNAASETRQAGAAQRIQGLQVLKNTLGRQNMRSLDTTS